MSRRRFFYLVPAESRHRLVTESFGEHLWRLAFNRSKRFPTGGVKVIYQHCAMLRHAGYEAAPVHLGHFTVDWFEHGCQPLTARQALQVASPEDILIIPERIPAAAAPFPCREKLAFVQNHGLVDRALSGRRYEDFGITGLLCCSPFLDQIMAARSDLPRHMVTNGIDLERFVPAPHRRQPNSVTYLKRKPSWHHGPAALAALSNDVAAKITVNAIPNAQSEADMIRHYQEADIFMALGYPEGFALPPLEAMACGAAVIGFSGGGGLTHMIDNETALVVRDGDADGLAAALARIVQDPVLKERIRAAGARKAAEFGIDAMRDQLLAFAESVADR